jgi:hypothetical protein
MNLLNIIKRATDFGTSRAQDYYFSFLLQSIFYMFPAIILGNYTDVAVERIQKDKILGDYTLSYILLQTLIIITTLYLISKFLTSYANEFETALAGVMFIVYYFNIQPHYITMIKEYLN